MPSFLLAAIVATSVQSADNISVLGNKPRWDVLERYQQTITHDEFLHLINDVYCTHGFAADLIDVNDDHARILMSRQAQKFFTLRFATDDAARKPVPRLWRPAKCLPATMLEKPLSGLKVALDPGHLGGNWAKMEERWFQVGDTKPVQEGDLTLQVARLLAPRLRQLGAKVSYVRNSDEPTTAKRPDDFRELSKKILIKNGVPQPRAKVLDSSDPAKEQTIRLAKRNFVLPLQRDSTPCDARELQVASRSCSLPAFQRRRLGRPKESDVDRYRSSAPARKWFVFGRGNGIR